jgi:hypothetical protein
MLQSHPRIRALLVVLTLIAAALALGLADFTLFLEW